MLVALISLLALVVWRLTPPAPQPASAPEQVFSAERALERLRVLLADEAPHPLGSPEAEAVRERLVGELQRLGYQPHVQEAFVCGGNSVCGRVRNVVARLEGREGGKAVLLNAHYDSVGAGPGASDDGMGVAALLEIARVLRTGPSPPRPVLFLFDEGEESGLLGAQAFMGSPLAGEVGVVVNLEARGTSGASLMFETGADNGWLIQTLAGAVERPVTSSLFPFVYRLLPSDTNVSVFTRHGLPALNFALIGDVARYHTPLDRLEYVEPASLQHHGEQALALVRALSQVPLESPPRGDAVFFDVLGSFLVSWPERWSLGLAVVGLALWLGAAVLRVRAGLELRRAVGLGLALWGAAGVSAGLALGYGRLLRALVGQGLGWPAQPAPVLVLAWLLPVAVAGAVLGLRRREQGAEEAWLGFWGLWALVAVGLAAAAPAASFLFIVPLWAQALAALVPALARVEPARWQPWACAAGALVAALLWFPPGWLLYASTGLSGLPAISAVAGLVAGGAAPVVLARRRQARVAALAAGAVLLTSGVVGALLPPWSEHSPERFNFHLHHDTGAGKSRLLMLRESKEALAAALALGAHLERAYPWHAGDPAAVLPVQAAPPPAPEWKELSRSTQGGERRVRALVRSPRGARTVMLYLPREAGRVSVSMEGQPARGGRRLEQGWRAFRCETLPPEGVQVELVLESTAPVQAVLTDITPGVPEAPAEALRLRPGTAAMSHHGDVTLVSVPVEL